MRIIILGGGSAGTSIAFELRKKDKDSEIIIIEKTDYNEYSPCSLPYVLCDEIKSFDSIMLFSDEDYMRDNIIIRKNCNITGIATETNKVYFVQDNKEECLEYDYLVYALGSITHLPTISIEQTPKYHFLRTLEDAKKLKNELHHDKKAIIIGAGLIGVESAYALAKSKHKVTLMEHESHILNSSLDNDMALRVEEYLKSVGVNIIKNAGIERIDNKKIYFSDSTYDYDILLFANGLSPNVDIARNSGLKVGQGIIVDYSFRTNINNIFASGDCIELQKLNDDNGCVMLGSLAYQSARIIAGNILGEKLEYKPVIGAAIAKMGDITIANTGMTLERAKKKNIKAYSMIIEGSTRSGYHPDAKKIVVKLIGNHDYELIGAQIIGGEDVSGRINLCSLAISERIKLDKIAFLETVYNPGSAPINEPLSICARMLIRKIDVMHHAK